MSAWTMPESEDRCPGCGRFVSIEDGFVDVEPGGCRGSDYCAAYCGPDCADRAYVEAHTHLGRECVCEA